jgi:hypothetical protein
MILLSFFNQIGHCNLACFRKKLSYKLLNFFINYLVWDAEHFEACADRTVYKKLKLNDLEPLYFIEIENIEKNFIKV